VSSLPPTAHDGGSIVLRKSTAGTTVTWASRFEVAVPALGQVLTPFVATVMATGFRLTLHTANRELTAKR
jgi:hypothetical protein